MSWYDSAWSNRHPVISDRGGVEGEWQITMPKNFDEFWDKIQDTTNGYDIIVTEQDGETLTTFDLSGFNHSTKTVTIRWNGAASEGSGSHGVYWIYWNKATPSDLSGSPTTASPTSALISLVDPGKTRFTLDATTERAGATAPSDEIGVTSSDDVMVWVRFPKGSMPVRAFPSEGSDSLYEPDSMVFSVLIAEVDQSKDTPAKNRVAEDKNGDFWFGVFFDGLSDATDYTGKIQMDLSSPTEPVIQIYKRFLIKCNNVNET